ncbi:nucleotidyltransferase domain-containing protein [Allobranchiibius sp. GilTou73]|uniref:nucleotidyltransferase domain-containing protein n=1 Tax=Allobranchiibius sp. GilTou73 TaxID=2904523 RepID=UPI001F1C542B|nr:nucleotidyltransferase domain-containing protein [Allobranchiibius sp. GilTou73]UIJ33957.1 nucleotidyltransferase domain-containing protein [Allobranchiibius sp. GilTou73]
MFAAADRLRVRDDLIAAARADPRVTAAALVGSAAVDRDDDWSDIDLALRLAPATHPGDVVESWTSALYDMHGAVAHTDLWSGPTLYRVFLLQTSLQVDLSLWPSDDFAAHGGAPFRLLFGEANEPPARGARSPDAMVGMAWLYALHARSSIARKRSLQAVSMLNGLREQVISLACLRYGLPPDEGRGVDQLPDAVKKQLTRVLVASTDLTELQRLFGLLTDALTTEIEAIDATQAQSLRPVLQELVRTAAPNF